MSDKIRIRDLMKRSHPLSPLSNRALFTGFFFALSIMIATMVIMISEGWSAVNSFYYIAMVTTTNGAPFPPTSSGVEIFTALWAYFSFIMLATIVLNAFGPLLGHLVKEGGLYIMKGEKLIENELTKDK